MIVTLFLILLAFWVGVFTRETVSQRIEFVAIILTVVVLVAIFGAGILHLAGFHV